MACFVQISKFKVQISKYSAIHSPPLWGGWEGLILMLLPVARRAKQHKVTLTAKQVGTITNTQYMMHLHFILTKFPTTTATPPFLTTIQGSTLTQQTVTNIAASVIQLWTTLHTVSRHIDTHTTDLPFLQKVHITSFLGASPCPSKGGEEVACFVQSSKFKVQSSNLKVQSSNLKVQISKFKVLPLSFSPLLRRGWGRLFRRTTLLSP